MMQAMHLWRSAQVQMFSPGYKGMKRGVGVFRERGVYIE